MRARVGTSLNSRWQAVLDVPYVKGTDPTNAFARALAFAKLGDISKAQAALAEVPAAPVATAVSVSPDCRVGTAVTPLKLDTSGPSAATVPEGLPVTL